MSVKIPTLVGKNKESEALKMILGTMDSMSTEVLEEVCADYYIASMHAAAIMDEREKESKAS